MDGAPAKSMMGKERTKIVWLNYPSNPTAAVAEPRIRIVPGGLVITVPVEIAAAASLRVPHGKNEERGNFRIDTSE